MKYLKNLRQIVDGYTSLVLDKHEQIAFERSKICAECPLFDKGFCSKYKEVNGVRGCSCWLSAKTRCVDCECPLNSWPKIEE